MSILSRLMTLTAALALLSSGVPAQEARKVTIGLASPSLPTSAPRIANQMGLFAKHGLEPRITQLDDSATVTAALIAGSVDFAVMAPSDIIIAQTRGQALVAAATIYGGYSPVLILSKKAAEQTGVAASAATSDRLKAVQGLLIATPSPISNFTLGLNCAAATVGAKPRLTHMAQQAMPAALEAGAIQGYMASAPFYGVAVMSGSGAMWVRGPKGEFPEGCSTAYAATLNTTRGFGEANPDVIRRVRAVFADFAEAVRQRPAEVKAAIGTLFPAIDRGMIDVLFESEASGFAALPPTAEGMAREIGFVKLGNPQLQGLENVDKAKLILP